MFSLYEKFEDTRGVIRSRKLKNRRHNGQKKKDRKTNSGWKNTMQKRKDWATLTLIKKRGQSCASEELVVPAPKVAPGVLLPVWQVINEERRTTLWYKYSVAVNQFMIVTVNFWSDDFNLTIRNHWFSNFLRIFANRLVILRLLTFSNFGVYGAHFYLKYF
jgi:hypothetical protein